MDSNAKLEASSNLGPRYPIPGVRYRSDDVAREQVRRGDWLDLSMGDSLRRTARRTPEKTAFVFEERAQTFRELDALSESFAASLLDLGLAPGDRALFQVGTTGDFFTAFFGCMKAGVIPVCTLPQFRSIEMEHFAAVTDAKAIIVQADVNPKFDQVGFALELGKTAPGLRHIIALHGAREGVISLEAMAGAYDLEAALARTKGVAPAAQDVAAFQLSGGSTNLPKIIPRTHGEYLASTLQLSQRYELTGDDVSLWSLPLIHNAGALFVVAPMALEGRTLILQSRVDIPEMLKLIARHRVTFTGSIGPIAAKLLEVQNPHADDISSLRQFFSLMRADAVEAHVGIPVSQMFGMTEGMLFAAAPTAPKSVRHDSIGYSVSPGDEVRLLEPGLEREVADGEIGELCFRGPSTLTGYFRDEAATATSFTSDGFFRSGDLMRKRELDGVICYAFEGRIKDNINRGGEKIGAEELETLVGQYPGVADARVVAMPDKHYGEKVCAYLIVHAEQEAPTVMQLCDYLVGRGLAKYKCPERIEVIDAFPVTRVGKADKAQLRAMIAEKITQETI